MKSIKTIIKSLTLGGAALCAVSILASCNGEKQVVIYTNADEESIKPMEEALDKAGYQGKYVFNSFSTSELGGKLMAEGKNIEADLVTVSSYYIDSAQDANGMFKDLSFKIEPLTPVPPYMAPITAQEGTLFYNTKVLKEMNLPVPTSIRDLAKPEYKGHISITNIKSSSTAWLLVQALVCAYGEQEARNILKDIIANAGPHFENSGSAPLKKVRAGEVAIGFGLRQQAVLDKKNGLPIEYVDPSEGNFMLKEAVCLPDHGAETHPDAMKIAEIMVKGGRPGIIRNYPVPVYQGEQVDPADVSRNIRQFPEALTVDLLKSHEKLMEQ